MAQSGPRWATPIMEARELFEHAFSRRDADQNRNSHWDIDLPILVLQLLHFAWSLLFLICFCIRVCIIKFAWETRLHDILVAISTQHPAQAATHHILFHNLRQRRNRRDGVCSKAKRRGGKRPLSWPGNICSIQCPPWSSTPPHTIVSVSS